MLWFWHQDMKDEGEMREVREVLAKMFRGLGGRQKYVTSTRDFCPLSRATGKAERYGGTEFVMQHHGNP
jgi:hypothetical protein